MIRGACFATLVAVMAACGSSTSAAPEAALDVPAGCQPLFANSACFLPFPSDFYLTPDSTMSTGHRVEMTGAAKLVATSGADADVVSPLNADGFSMHSTIIASLPVDLEGDGLPNLMDDPSVSATLASPTLLLDTSTGLLVPHYVDLDLRPSDPTRRSIVIHAFAPLSPTTRYIVALTGVLASDGTHAPPPEGFRRLRDADVVSTRDPSIAAISPHFESDIFPALVTAGVARNSLQLAWDFTTGTQDHPIADMISVRTQTLAYLAAHSPAVSITSVDAGTATVWKTIHGTVTAPMFLASTDLGAPLLRDANNAPMIQGTIDVPFYVTIPNTVRDDFGPARAIAYGHGFFGDFTELDSDGAHAIGTTLHAIEFGIDWWGMSKPDEGFVANTLASTPDQTLTFTDRVHQAMVNWMTMTQAIKGALSKDQNFMRPSSGPGTSTQGTQTNAGAPLYDPSIVYYFGASQGGILGTVISTLNPDFSRSVINVGGGPFTHLMPRAAPFSPFFLVANGTMGDTLAAQTLIASFQPALDRIDPAAFAPHLLDGSLDQSPSDRRVLFQAGLGDQEVPNLGTFYLVRELGIPQTSPTPAEEFGIMDSTSTGLTSALTLWDFGVDLTQYRTPQPIAQNAVHDGLRMQATALAQMDAFYKPGAASTIIFPCPAACVASQ